VIIFTSDKSCSLANILDNVLERRRRRKRKRRGLLALTVFRASFREFRTGG
jgi:hypothetical protein